jgi:hypothetical protein
LVYTTTSGVAFTLPLANSVPAGRVVYLASYSSSGGCSAKTQGSDVMYIPYESGTFTNTGVAPLNPVGSMIFVSDGVSKWICIAFM